MPSHFQIELEKLNSVIEKIGLLAASQVNEATKALLHEESDIQKKEIKKTENKIDKLDIKIDEICQSIFALQQPVASDLRFIMSAIQISNEIERIGDLSVSIIKKNKGIKQKHHLIEKFDVATIAKEVENIVLTTNACFENRDESKIAIVFSQKNSIKAKTDALLDIIVETMKNSSKIIVSGTNLILILKDLERIAEHCTNIAEYVYFMIHAKIIKHEKFEDNESNA
jgi:phosphate transport system protein